MQGNIAIFVCPIGLRMFDRIEKDMLEEWMEDFPAVGIIGARQVGKTTLAKSLLNENSIHLDLESDLDIGLMAQPGIFFRQNADKRIIIDEVQRMPELFSLLRAIIDEDRRPGRFILLGSASPNLLRDSSESLAGRIAYVELSGLNLLEIGPENLLKLWTRGGFPLSFQSSSDKKSIFWRKQLTRTFVERDLPALGLDANAQQLNRLLIMLAGQVGQLYNASTFAKALGITPPTVRKYVDFFQNAFIVDFLQPYHINIKKRLTKSPKIYFNDPGIMHSLLGIGSYNDLIGHAIAGFSWENFAIRQIKSILKDEFEYHFYRTQDGTESDLVLVQNDTPLYSLEFKFTNTPKPTKGTHLAIQDLGTTRNFIVTPENRRYPITENLEVISLTELIEVLTN